MGMCEIEEQHLACQVRGIFKNKRITENVIWQLQKQVEKDEIVPERIDTMSRMSCREARGTETVGEQCCDAI